MRSLFKYGALLSLIKVSLETASEMSTMAECANCLALSSQYVCLNDYGNTLAFCCSTGDTSNYCAQKYCSTNAKTTSMMYQACPY